jgi:hypothetical protein
MSNRTRWGTAVFAAVAVAGLAIAGDEPKTYDIDWKEHWEAKQTVTYTVHETSDTDTSMAGNSMKKDHEAVDAVYVVRCDEAGADGSLAKQTVFVKSWKCAKDTTTDESLTGALLTVTGKEWKLDGGKTAGSLAKKWLDKKFGNKNDSSPLEKIAPKQLTIGQPWKPDPKVVAEAFSKSMDDAPFDASGVTMELVLDSAEGTPPDASGKCSFKVHLPIGKLPKMPPNATLRPGSGAEMTGTRTGPLTKSTMLGVLHMDVDLKMDVDVETPQGAMAVNTTGKMVADQTIVAGGDIPEPAKPAEGEKK